LHHLPPIPAPHSFPTRRSSDLCFRYLAGALGISFIPVKSLLSSEILERLETGSAAKDIKRMHCPFTGEEYLLLRALNPDISFVRSEERRVGKEGRCGVW